MSRGILHALFAANKAAVRDKDVLYILLATSLIFFMIFACLGFVHSALEQSVSLTCAALGLSILQLVHFNVAFSHHICIVCFIVLYQLLEPIKAAGGKINLSIQNTTLVEGIVVAVVIFVIAFEDIVVFYLIRQRRDKVSSPETMEDLIYSPIFNQFAGKIASFVLISLSLIPYANVNVFALSLQYKSLLIFTWGIFALTESYKNEYSNTIDMTSTPCKCSPILYLPYYYWAIVAFFILINIYLIYKTQPRKMVTIDATY